MRILISGSLAYDRILNFPGRFAEHIIPERIHDLNVSFFVPEMQESFGGCAGNIAYTLALLGEEPLILSRGGNDFEPYRVWLNQHAIDTGTVEIEPGMRTAFATIITDERDNQITAFYPGAVGESYSREIPDGDMAIISPGNPGDMRTLPARYRERGIPFIFDPGQQIPTLAAADLLNGITGAAALITNDYELALIMQKTGLTEDALLSRTSMLVTTRGADGSRITTKDGVLEIPAAHADNASDPTGAGDAFRAGFIAGLARKLPLAITGRLAALTACYTVERFGTQTHTFTIDELKARYTKNFNDTLPL